MPPVPIPDSFWSHLPGWIWPVVVIGLVGFFLYEAIRGSSAVARLFGNAGAKIRARATRARRMDEKLDRIEGTLDQARDQLECSTAYLVRDADWHLDADMIIAEAYPGLTRLLPSRVPFTDFQKKWRDGWRPASYVEG